MQNILSVIGAITGIFGMIVSIAGFFRNRMETVISYFEYDKDDSYIEARRAVHNMPIRNKA